MRRLAVLGIFLYLSTIEFIWVFKMVERGRWAQAAYVLLAFLMILGGFLTEDAVRMVFGIALAFAITSAFLTSYVKSERKIKKALEVVSAFVALGIIIYGYVLTGSLLLGILTLFITVMFSIAFIVSYLLPKIHKPKQINSKPH